MISKTGRVLLCSLLFLPMLLTVKAQDDYAAVLTVMRSTVEIRRVNTEQWISLPENATTPFGVGDALRTDHWGRAYLTFLDEIELLILTESTYGITAFIRAEDGSVQLNTWLEGQAIQRSPAEGEIRYELGAGRVNITRPADLFAVWTNFEDTTVVTVVDGRVELATAEGQIEVRAGEGFYTDDAIGEVVRFDAPHNAARLLAEVRGCIGTVNSGDEESLNIRSGTGLGYTIIGYIPNGGPVTLMGTNGWWRRVQRFGGFGWVEALAIETDCENLPVFPRLFEENNLEVFGVRPIELELFEPFYGRMIDNLWFYRGTAGG